MARNDALIKSRQRTKRNEEGEVRSSGLCERKKHGMKMRWQAACAQQHVEHIEYRKSAARSFSRSVAQ